MRLLSLAPSHTEWIFALGAEARLVGRTDQCDAPPQARLRPSIGGLFPPDYERIVAARPDLALMLDGSAQIRARLETLGVKVLVFQPRDLNGIYREGRVLGRLLGLEARAEAVISGMEAQLRGCVTPITPPPSVFYEVWPDPLSAAGADTFITALIEAAGARSVVTARGWPRYDLERLLVARPRFIVTPHGPRARRAPAWARLEAVAAGRVIYLDDPALLARPGPRAVEGICALAARLRASP